MAGVLERFAGLAKAVLTISDELQRLRAGLEEVRQEARALDADMREIQLRVVRLETMREADRSQTAADVARFMAEFERAGRKLLQAPSTKPSRATARRKKGQGGS
jgi:hypothetical protein